MNNILPIILVIVVAVVGSRAEAQQATNIPRIGYLSEASAEADKNRFAHFRRGMQELGYIEGKNIVIEQRYAAGQSEKISELPAELIRLKVDVLVVYGDAAIPAARNATSPIPIVMTVHPDPVRDGIVAALRVERDRLRLRRIAAVLRGSAENGQRGNGSQRHPWGLRAHEAPPYRNVKITGHNVYIVIRNV